MGWARFDDAYPIHPKVQRIPEAVRADAMALELAALCYSTRLLTDGFVPRGTAASLALEVGFSRHGKVDFRRLNRAVSALVSASRWHENGGSGWQIHDFNQYQPSADEVKERRRKEAEKKRRQRAQERLSLETSPETSPGDKTGESPGESSRVRASGAGAPARPAPPLEGADLPLPRSTKKPDLASPPAHRQKAAPSAICPICGPLHSVPTDFDLREHIANVHGRDPDSVLGPLEQEVAS